MYLFYTWKDFQDFLAIKLEALLNFANESFPHAQLDSEDTIIHFIIVLPMISKFVVGSKTESSRIRGACTSMFSTSHVTPTKVYDARRLEDRCRLSDLRDYRCLFHENSRLSSMGF